MKKFQPDFKKTYAEHSRLFKRFSDNGLVAFYNLELGRPKSDQEYHGIRIALEEEFEEREIDFSAIRSVEAPEIETPPVIMVGKILFWITEVPLEIAEGLVMMYLKAGKAEFKGLRVTSRSEKEICYSLNGKESVVSALAVIRSFTEGLLNPAG